MKQAPLIPVIFGSGFGSGFWPWGPGTAGAILATLLWLGLGYFICPETLFWVTLASIIIFTIIGTWATNKLEPFWGEDPSRVVIDEMVGVWVPLLASSGSIWWAVASLLLFRFFDILKPFGIRNLDNRSGGFWVMADDILAGIYSLIIICIARWII